jgi:hypothetical protein
MKIPELASGRSLVKTCRCKTSHAGYPLPSLADIRNLAQQGFSKNSPEKSAMSKTPIHILTFILS